MKTLCNAEKSLEFERPYGEISQKEIISREKAAWLAGIIDGEGHIRLHKIVYSANPSIQTQIKVDNNNLRIIQKISQIYKELNIKFSYQLKKRYSKKHRFGMTITVTGFGSCKKLLTFILPYLVGKKEETNLMLKFIELREEKWSRAKPNHIPFRTGKNAGFAKYTEKVSYGKEEWQMFEEMKALKHKDFNPQRLSRKASQVLRDDDIVRAYEQS